MNAKFPTLAAFAAMFILFANSSLATELSKEEAGSVPSIDLEKLEEKEPSMAGKVVRLKFNYRSTDVTKNDDGSIRGWIYLWKYNANFAGSNYKSGGRSVHVPAEGAEWFLKQPAKESRSSLLIYARLPAKPSEPAKLLGREIKTDLKGSRIVW